MSLIPLQLPAGFYRNGTEFQASNRWRDGTLVRFNQGTLRPIGGWRTPHTISGETQGRSLVAWIDLGGTRRFAVGYHSSLYAVTSGGVQTDITPADLAAGSEDAYQASGYGSGFYGSGVYGTTTTSSATFQEATTWSLDTWGQNLVACSVADGRLLEWDLNVSNNAAPITNAPTDCLGLVVTDERFLMALGAGGDSRKVAWCDREDNTTWTAATTNEAGDLNLQAQGEIMLGIRTRGQTLILTSQEAFSATYIGPPYVFGFERVGTSCGVISRKAAAAADEGVFWMGERGFHLYSGGAVRDIPCEVADHVFDDINRDQKSKIFAVTNSKFNEVWFFYPSADSTDNNRYVVFNYAENHWVTGELNRAAGVDSGVFPYPLWACNSGQIHEQEVGFWYNDRVPYAETGPISLGNGDQVMHAVMLIPDENTQGDVTATFKTRFHPNDTERSYGPYSMASPTDVRFTGRQVRMRVTSARATDWCVGTMRLDAFAGGKR